jgi:peroxiredoxin
VKRDPVVIIVVAMVVTVMLVVGFQVARRNSGRTASTGDNNMKGQPAPDFTLESLDGKTVHLSDFRGKGVLLNFWATWCQPCKIEMPWFAELQKQYGPQGLQIVGIAMDDASPKEIGEFAHDLGVNYPILVGKEAVGDAYGGVQFLPATFYIGRDGKVIDKVFGLKGRGEIEDSIKKALAEGQAVRARK